MLFNFNNEQFNYMGRIDNSDEKAPIFYYSGSTVSFSFIGTSLSVLVKNKLFWGETKLGVILDGENISVPFAKEGSEKIIEISVANGLENTTHTVEFFKNNCANNLFSLHGVITDGEILKSDKRNRLKIEVFGDSVCAGSCADALDYVAKVDPEGDVGQYDNGYESFVMKTARNLDAVIYNNSQGGIAILDDTGYFNFGLETTYDKMRYFNTRDELTKWDFSRFTPDIVIIELAQNDEHNNITKERTIMLTDLAHKEKWKTKYKELVRELNAIYKNAPAFIFTTTLLMHYPLWDETIEEIKVELAAEGIKTYHNMFVRNGAGTPGHPRVPEHEEMALELTSFIRENGLDVPKSV